MNLELELQLAVDTDDVPAVDDFRRWAAAALAGHRSDVELTIRVVSRHESQSLNAAYRGKSGPTNVLSFAADLPGELELPLLGDLVICASLVRSEAREQGKPEHAHWAHLVVHGCLHLLGFDHVAEHDAEKMERLETVILDKLGYPDPYSHQFALTIEGE